MKKLKLWLFCLMYLALASCKQTTNDELEKNANRVEESMRMKLGTREREFSQLAQLGSVEYVTRHLYKEKTTNDKGNGRYTVIGEKVTTIAGIDLKDFSMDDVVVNDSEKSVSITLPKAKILSYDFSLEDAKEIHGKSGFFYRKNTPMEIQEIEKRAQMEIENTILGLGILDEAEQKTKDLFYSWLSQMGFKIISIKFADGKSDITKTI